MSIIIPNLTKVDDAQMQANIKGAWADWFVGMGKLVWGRWGGAGWVG